MVELGFEDGRHWMVLSIVVFISALVGAMLGASSVHSTWSLDAAQTQCAQFNPKSGHFEWLPPILKIPSS
jgi:hypothetical protein